MLMPESSLGQGEGKQVEVEVLPGRSIATFGRFGDVDVDEL